MSAPSEEEKAILVNCFFDSGFFKISEDLTPDVFSDERLRKIFRFCSERAENGDNEISLAEVSDYFRGRIEASFISSLLDGVPKLSPEAFLRILKNLRKKRLTLRLASSLKRELDSALKTGQALCLDPIRSDLAALDRLDQPQVNLIALGQIEPKPISWLWPGRIPLGMLSLLVGDPGVGKSLLSIFLAAKLSKGERLPDSPEKIDPCSTLFILGEDPLAQAVRPRAEVNGADLSRIVVLPERSGFSFANLSPLRAALEKRPDVRFVVLDPLTAFFPPRTRYFEDPSVRQALLPLVELAEEKDVAILAVAHLRKAEAESVIHRVGGSVGIAAVARSIIGVTTDENDPERKLILPMKSNYSRRPSGLAFRIRGDLRIMFEDQPVDKSAEDAFASAETRERRDEKNFNQAWLRGFLKDGAKSVQEIEKAAHEVGISRRTLYRVADRLGIVSRSKGEGRFKTWSLQG